VFDRRVRGEVRLQRSAQRFVEVERERGHRGSIRSGQAQSAAQEM
jgi:hypothetical protein